MPVIFCLSDGPVRRIARSAITEQPTRTVKKDAVLRFQSTSYTADGRPVFWESVFANATLYDLSVPVSPSANRTGAPHLSDCRNPLDIGSRHYR